MKKDYIVELREEEANELMDDHWVGELVRCKDCRYGQKCVDGKKTFQCFKWNCGEFGILHEPDWFCADGERK